MSTPWSIVSTLNFPGAPTLPAAGVPANATGSFDSKATATFKVTGSGTVAMGNVPTGGCKALLIEVEAGSGIEPVLVTLNGADTPIEISAGGFILVANPSPSEGVTSISIEYGTACTINVWALG